MSEPPPKGNWQDDSKSCQNCRWVELIDTRPDELFCSNPNARQWISRLPNVTNMRTFTNCTDEGLMWAEQNHTPPRGEWR